ncbi:hypothetical protein ACE1TI_00680 [Alteribacillus sp. JSM 102045]|uniref:YkoP family protein n=1 Tax=Alteribacillus sp. JSM 102045 TaxID=1562101 RepID=UPI0035BF550D
MRNFFVYTWTVLDPFYFKLTRLTDLYDSSDRFNNIFRVRLTSYKGTDVTLSDGTKINKNDTLLKIHLHNIRLINEMNSLQSDIHKVLYLYKMVQQSLPGLAAYIQNLENNDQIKGIMGITLLNKGCARLGFESFDITNPFYKCFKLLPSLAISMLATPTASLSSLRKKQPKYIFMSKEKLFASCNKTHQHQILKQNLSSNTAFPSGHEKT